MDMRLVCARNSEANRLRSRSQQQPIVRNRFTSQDYLAGLHIEFTTARPRRVSILFFV